MFAVVSHQYGRFLQHCNVLRKIQSANISIFEPHKMVLIVPQDIKMGKGKLASQCAHAAVKAYANASPLCRRIWELNGQPKIVLKCEVVSQLIELHRLAEASKLATALICDAGRTQVKAGTYTVLGIGPAPSGSIDLLTCHLKLL